MGFLTLFVVSLFPVLKILLVTLTGLFLSLERIDILRTTAKSKLNRMVFYVFYPALVGGYAAKSVTWEVIVEMWFMPVNILLTFVVGSILGWILVKIARTPPLYHGLIIGCCAAGNIGNLLFIMIPVICDESDSPFGDSSTCTTNGDIYISISMAFGAVYMWSYVFMLIKLSTDRAKRQEVAINGSTNGTRESNQTSETETFPGEISEPLLSSENHASLGDLSYNVNIPENEHEVPLSHFQKIKQKITKLITTFDLNMIFTPVVIAALIGLTVGMVSPLRKLLVGDSAPLRTIYSSTYLIGQAAIPCLMLILGANLLEGFKTSGLGLIVIIGIIVVKYIALPGIGIAIVKAAQHFGWIGSNSLYQFVLMIQYAVPPSMQVGTMTQHLESGQNDSSVIMFWAYIVAVFSLTLWSTLFMSLVS